MHANQWFELLNTIEGAVDERRQKQEDISGPTSQQIKDK